MIDGERIKLYNELLDFKEELEGINYPSQTKKIDILRRAVEYVRGYSAQWMNCPDTQRIISNGRYAYSFPCICSFCRFDRGFSDFKLCPQCGSRMQRK